MNDQLSGTTAAAPGVVSGHTGAMAFVPQAAPLPGPALTREDIPGLVNAAPEGEERLDADWLWDEVVNVAIAPGWPACYILQLRNALLRERRQNFEASERAKRERAAAEAADLGRASRLWVEQGKPEVPPIEDQLAALTREFRSLGTDFVLLSKRLFDVEEAGKAPKPTTPPGRIPRPPGKAA